jgi:hypothetical protein
MFCTTTHLFNPFLTHAEKLGAGWSSSSYPAPQRTPSPQTFTSYPASPQNILNPLIHKEEQLF